MKNMRIEVTSPSPQVAEAARQHLGLSTHTYELWFLADIVGEPQPKNRATLNALLKEALQMLADAAAEAVHSGGVVGSAEIVHRWGEHGQHDETVWSMSLDEFTKGHRLPIKAL